MKIDPELLKKIIEGALMASSSPLNVVKLQNLFKPGEHELDLDEIQAEVPNKEEILAVLEDIQNETVDRGFELKQVGNGWRFQVVQETARWIGRLWEEKPAKYTRALLETLSLIAYRQPITRGDIESIRGVAVSSNIIRTLSEREWVKVVGHRDVPGRPALYATTREFLDYFNIKSLEELPSLKEIQDIDKVGTELELLVNEAQKKLQAEDQAVQEQDLNDQVSENQVSENQVSENQILEEHSGIEPENINLEKSEEAPAESTNGDDVELPSNVVQLDPH